MPGRSSSGWHGGHGGHRHGQSPLHPGAGSHGWPHTGQRARRPPPWWPEGEPWPPGRPPWHRLPRRTRRRFKLAALVVLASFIGVALLLALVVGEWDGRSRRGPPEDGEGGPRALVAVVGGIVVVGGGATALAYRRISRPVGDLLGAAEQVAEGDYDVSLEPDGPRELRVLATSFNDMAAQLAAADEQRRRFLADVTHELRTPLAVLQSEVEAQLDGIHPRDDTHLGSMLEEVQRLGRLAEDVHTLALAEAGRIVLHRERVLPGVLVEEAVEAHAALAQQQGVEVRPLVAPNLPELDVDPRRIRQVLDNLLTNAARHTPRGGEVTAEVASTPDEGDGQAEGVRFTVTDAGPGFPPGQLDQIFERFVRAVDSRGSGLGLSIARDLVQAHGGSIEARNDPVTGGASVRFWLPSGVDSP